jgi:hypothetical protein
MRHDEDEAPGDAAEEIADVRWSPGPVLERFTKLTSRESGRLVRFPARLRDTARIPTRDRDEPPGDREDPARHGVLQRTVPEARPGALAVSDRDSHRAAAEGRDAVSVSLEWSGETVEIAGIQSASRSLEDADECAQVIIGPRPAPESTMVEPPKRVIAVRRP